MHYAILTLPYTGHLNPLLALGRALQRRGHRVTMVAPPDAEPKTRRAGLEFIPFASKPFARGTWPERTAGAAKLTGFAATRTLVRLHALAVREMQQELPAIAARARFDGLVMDQIVVGTEGVCQVIGLPLAVACAALPFQIESTIPPATFVWPHDTSLTARIRNLCGQFVVNISGIPVGREVMPYRYRHRLRPTGPFYINELRPSLVQVAQLPASFDFPRQRLPKNFHYTGPWIDSNVHEESNFPWDRLDGRPLVYASLGTLQNGLEPAFRAIVEGCADLDVQLILALGRKGAMLPGITAPNAIIVDYAPQPVLVRRARLVITHGGLNTALECLQAGVPMLALPITNDQPGVAARIRHFNVGDFIPVRDVTPQTLRELAAQLLGSERVKSRAVSFATALLPRDSVGMAAELIERAFKTRQQVRRC